MKTNPFYKYNKNRNMDPKEKENINEEELMSEATQDEAAENEEIQEEDVQDSAAPTEEEKLAQELEEANKVIEEQKDKYLRLSAEFDNYRKRTLKEKTELILNGGEKVLTALLPVLDDLERAAANIEKSDDIETLKEGVALIIDKLNKSLAAQGLQRIDTIGKAFDTDFHEAVAMIPAQEEEQKNHVIDCVQTGYLLNEKVIRHAKVVVGQ